MTEAFDLWLNHYSTMYDNLNINSVTEEELN